MALAIDPQANFDYVLECDRGLDPQDPSRSVFTLRRLRFGEMRQLQNDFSETTAPRYRRGPSSKRDARVTTRTRAGDMLAFVLVRGIIGVLNYKRPNGEAVIWPTDQAERERALEGFDPDHAAELSEQVLGQSKLEEDDGKN